MLKQLFEPLRRNQSVFLFVTDDRLPKKTRNYRPVLMLVPVQHAGCPTGTLLAAMPPYGSELIDMQDLKSISFVRIGMKPTLAAVLAEALKEFFKGESNE